MWQTKHFQKLSNSQKGFTILELTIATAIFSVLLVTALTAFVQISKMFNKGVLISRSGATIRDVSDDMAQNINASKSITLPTNTGWTGVQYMCLGSTRYTFALKRTYNQTANIGQATLGLVKDVLPGSGGCANPNGGTPFQANAEELLGDRMMLSALNVSASAAQGLYRLDLQIAFGDYNGSANDDFIDDPDTSGYLLCNSSPGSSTFCATSRLSTFINKAQ